MPQCTSVIRAACRIGRKTLKRFPHRHNEATGATATKGYKYICHIHIDHTDIYINIYLWLHMCFCFKIQINFFPPKDFIHFGFNTFLFFTPFCVLSGNLRGSRGRGNARWVGLKGGFVVLWRHRHLLDLNSIELAIKKG